MARLFRLHFPLSAAALLASDFVVISLSYLSATFALLRPDAQAFLTYENGWARMLIVVVCLILGIYFCDLYTNVRAEPRELLQQVGATSGAVFIAEAMLLVLKLEHLVAPAGPMIAGSVCAIGGVLSWRLFFSRVLIGKLRGQRVLFVGDSQIVQQIARHLAEHPEKGLMPVGSIDEPDATQAVVKRFRPDRIVAARELPELRSLGVPVEAAAATYEIALQRIASCEIDGLRFNSGWAEQARSILSFSIAIAALTLLAPAMLAIAALVKLTSPGPILLRQRRLGKDDRVFTLYKFRSMVQDAEANSGAVWATRNDPRVTAFGYWIRMLRLDELPQLFNVLRGEMSIVGPRPERPELVERIEPVSPHYRKRHCIKPGITGWAQINHKYCDNAQDSIAKFEYDMYYIKNRSVAMDALIMLRTAKVMLRARGAQ